MFAEPVPSDKSLGYLHCIRVADKNEMILPKIYLFAILLLAFAGANGQEPPKAVLVDEFGTFGCDELLGRLDNYLQELRNEPASYGLVVIRNDSSRRHKSVFTQELIEAHFRWRNWKQSRLEYVRADHDRGEQLVQLWRMSPGSSRPEIDRQIESFPFDERVRQPFMMGYETKFGAQICPEVDEQRIFVNFLKGNPTSRGNIVVRDNSRVRARAKGERILRKFVTRNGIARSRIRIFQAKLQLPSNHDEPIVEYWYLP